MKPTNIPEGYISRKTSTIDFGYEESEIDGYLKPIPEQLKLLYTAEQKIKQGKSTRVVARWLSKKSNRYISHVGLWKHVTNKTSHEFIKVCNKQKEGYIYILTNPAWQDWVKVGMAVDPEDRCSTFQIGSPFRDYDIFFTKFFKDKQKAESNLHKLLKKEAEQFNGEWFKIDKNETKRLIENYETK